MNNFSETHRNAEATRRKVIRERRHLKAHVGACTMLLVFAVGRVLSSGTTSTLFGVFAVATMTLLCLSITRDASGTMLGMRSEPVGAGRMKATSAIMAQVMVTIALVVTLMAAVLT